MTEFSQRPLPPWLSSFEARRTTHTLGQPVVYEAQTASTNTLAASLARHGARDGLLVVTDDQRAGRGRLGRAWHAAPGQNLTVSLVLRPHFPVADWPLVSFALAVALARTLETRTPGHTAHVKWPNDVLLGGRKVAGVLLETVHRAGTPAALIAGVGVNVNQQAFPALLHERATSLAALTGTEHAREAVLAHLLAQFEALLPLCAGEGRAILLQLYTARLAGLGGPVVFHETGTSTPVEGRLVGLTPAGTLQIDTAEGIRTFHAGDLTTQLP